jgi:hypothetical protein
MLALDGVYAEDDDGFLRFHAVGAPSDKEMELPQISPSFRCAQA